MLSHGHYAIAHYAALIEAGIVPESELETLFPNTLITFGNRLPDPRMADECLRDGVFDYWEACRPLLADPELIHKAAN